jgi:Tfp pilus assembly protein PilV
MIPGEKEATMISQKNDSKSGRGIPRGFALIEALVSILIIILGVMFISRIMIHSMDALKKSKSRLDISEKLQFYSNYLMSRPFSSAELRPGKFTRRDQEFTISWDVIDVTPSLKKIYLKIRISRMTRQEILYKSGTILPVAFTSPGEPTLILASGPPSRFGPMPPGQPDESLRSDRSGEKFT